MASYENFEISQKIIKELVGGWARRSGGAGGGVRMGGEVSFFIVGVSSSFGLFPVASSSFGLFPGLPVCFLSFGLFPVVSSSFGLFPVVSLCFGSFPVVSGVRTKERVQ